MNASPVEAFRRPAYPFFACAGSETLNARA